MSRPILLERQEWVQVLEDCVSASELILVIFVSDHWTTKGENQRFGKEVRVPVTCGLIFLATTWCWSYTAYNISVDGIQKFCLWQDCRSLSNFTWSFKINSLRRNPPQVLGWRKENKICPPVIIFALTFLKRKWIIWVTFLRQWLCTQDLLKYENRMTPFGTTRMTVILKNFLVTRSYQTGASPVTWGCFPGDSSWRVLSLR